MSVVAAIIQNGKIYMGADSYVGTEGRSDILADPKLMLKNDMLIGITGSARVIDVVAEDFSLPTRPKRRRAKSYIKIDVVNALYAALDRNDLLIEHPETKRIELEDGEILIGYEGVVYILDSSFACIVPGNNYTAIGMGGDYALGSLFTTKDHSSPIKRLNLALKAAEYHCESIRQPFIIQTLG